MQPLQHFLKLSDCSEAQLLELLSLAALLKKQKKAGIPHPHLLGQSVALYFEKPSNRTRLSFEVALNDLGAHPVMIRRDEISLGVRESVADTARTLSRFVNGLMIRTFSHAVVEELAQWSSIPVINGLTDDHHPCQVLADLLSIQEETGCGETFSSQTLAFIGDGSNNMAHSLLEAGALTGLNVRIITPQAYAPNLKVVGPLLAQYPQRLQVLHPESPQALQQAVLGANVLYTDVWTSMGQEAEQAERLQHFAMYQINTALLQATQVEQSKILHCLPAHRGEEITHEVLEQHADSIFNQAENRLHAQKAVLFACLAKHPSIV